MLKNYLTTAIRNLFRNKIFSIINIAGLSLGMACCFLILTYLQHEFNYDKFHEKADQIYRINYGADFAGEGLIIAGCPPPLAPILKEKVSDIKEIARMYGRQVSISTKDPNGNPVDAFEVQDQYFADSTILDIFTFNFLHGNPKSALDAPGSIIVTDEMANQFFGTTNAIGKTLFIQDTYPFQVTGVIEELPETSHIQINMVAPYADMFNTAPEAAREGMRQNLNSNWVISHSYTYTLLPKGADVEAVNKSIAGVVQEFGNPTVREKQNFRLMPITDIHLNSQAGMEPVPPANLQFLYIFLAIGFITLLIAAINFVNFSTAGSLTRAKEVGVRKVLGAGKGSIISQFLGESLILSFIAFLFSLVVVQFIAPYLNDITGREVNFSLFDNGLLLTIFFGIFLIAGLLAGSYPAFFVTRFKPVSILRGKGFSNVPRGAALRKVLITIQFVASIALIAGSIGIYQQLEYLRAQPMGFQSEQILNVPLFSRQLNSIFGGVDGTLRQKMNSFEEELLKNPKVEATTLSAGIPGNGGARRNVTSENITAEDNLYITSISVDYDFLETYEMEMLEGRGFSKDFGTDHLNAFVINESTMQSLQWENPEEAIGKPLNREGKQGTIIGVMKDFHNTSLHQEILPLIYDVQASVFSDFSIKISNSEIPTTISFIESKWKEFFPEKVFEYTFLDETLENQYQAEDRLGKMIGYFAFLAILISCFGLYGLVAYAATQKTKEIGIRKVLGASIPSIFSMLSKEFVLLILVAGMIALPAAYFWMTNWLTNYPYSIDIGIWLAIVPLVSVLLIALFTISYQALKAAFRNPVEALRHK